MYLFGASKYKYMYQIYICNIYYEINPFGIFVHSLMDLLVASWTVYNSLDRAIGPSDLVRCPYSLHFCTIYLHVLTYTVTAGWALGRDVAICKFLCL